MFQHFQEIVAKSVCGARNPAIFFPFPRTTIFCVVLWTSLGKRLVLAFFNTTYHDILRCIVNIFRLEIGASFFNTTYHDFLCCIVNIFRLEIGGSFFFNTTYHKSVPSYNSLLHTHALHFPLPKVQSIPYIPLTSYPPINHGNIHVADESFARRHLAVPIPCSLQCLFVCLFVWTLYKFTFLNWSEPNFAHISPLV
jgi:hypothetical protein